MRRISPLVTRLAVSLGITCDDLTGPEAVAGTYRLQAVGDSSTPFVYRVGTYAEVVDGVNVLVEESVEWNSELQMDSDGTFKVTTTLQTTKVVVNWTGDTLSTTVTPRPDDTSSWSGSYTVTNGSIQLTYPGGKVYPTSLSGDVLTVIIDGVARVWER